MGKVKNNFIKRVSTAIKYIFNNTSNTAIESCEACGSTEIEFFDRTRYKEPDVEVTVYKAKYKCKKCGATCKATELWDFSL